MAGMNILLFELRVLYAKRERKVGNGRQSGITPIIISHLIFNIICSLAYE